MDERNREKERVTATLKKELQLELREQKARFDSVELEIRREVGDQIHFIVASGDLTAGGKREEYEAYLQTLAGWSCYHAAGNHDDDRQPHP